MYLALYRKFRPESFDQVIGQEHIIRTLKNQILNDQVGHAYLFCGSRGTGKTSVAKIFAKAVNCIESKDCSPCGHCAVCKNLAQTKDIDIVEIDAASNNRVDEVRDLRDKVKYPPLYGKYKVYIIDEVHMLTDSAFNALLKTLEEPPAHIIFILATTEPQKLPATILSRVLRFDFKLVGQNELCGLLKNIFAQSGIKAEDEAISLIAQSGNGSVRDALSIADMCASYSNNNITYSDVLAVLGTSDQQVLLTLTHAILEGNIAEFIRVFDEEVKSGKNIITLSTDITKQFRDLLVIKANGISKDVVTLPQSMQEKLLEVSSKYSITRINEAFQAFSGIEADLKYATSPQLLIEATAIGLSNKNKQEGMGSLAKEFPQHEQKVNTKLVNDEKVLKNSKDFDKEHIDLCSKNIQQDLSDLKKTFAKEDGSGERTDNKYSKGSQNTILKKTFVEEDKNKEDKNEVDKDKDNKDKENKNSNLGNSKGSGTMACGVKDAMTCVSEAPQSYTDYLNSLMEKEIAGQEQKKSSVKNHFANDEERSYSSGSENADTLVLDVCNPRKVWGQVLIELHNINVILHAACVDIQQVDIKGNNFIIGADHDSIVNTIKKVENYSDLVACFSKLGYNYNVNIINQKKTEKKIDKSKLLSQKLGISVQVKNKK